MDVSPAGDSVSRETAMVRIATAAQSDAFDHLTDAVQVVSISLSPVSQTDSIKNTRQPLAKVHWTFSLCHRRICLQIF